MHVVELPYPYAMDLHTVVVAEFEERADALRFCNKHGLVNGRFQTITNTGNTYYVKVPDTTSITSDYVVVATFTKHQQAVEFARRHLGTDINGILYVVQEV